jgi:hypothetical protein
MSQDYAKLYDELKQLEVIANNILYNPPVAIPEESKALPPHFSEVVKRFFSQRDWEEVEAFNEVLEEIHNRLGIQNDDLAETVEEIMQLVDDLIDTAQTGGYSS